jgi:outer membrane protein OmpA-like peptidoglycan-associated protein
MTSRTSSALTLLAAITGAIPAIAQDYSTSVIRPTALAKDKGVIAGPLPGRDGAKTYYLSTDLQAGALQTQIKVTAGSDAVRSITLELLGPDARTKDTYYVKTSRNEQNEATRSFPIDSAGTHTLRVIVDGPETGRFCVLLGGSALPDVTAPTCPSEARAAASEPRPAPPPTRTVTVAPPQPEPPKTVSVLTSRCEQRMRVGSEVLFDFDKATLRPEALPALNYVAQVVQQTGKPVTVEGHTDAIGTDAYNMRLSEQRALTVRFEIGRRMALALPIEARGLGKSAPIADNQYPDGTDNPTGRQLNRRVEIVVNTCG